MSEEYRDLVKRLTEEEKQERSYLAKLEASRAKQSAMKLQLKALRYEGDSENG